MISDKAITMAIFMINFRRDLWKKLCILPIYCSMNNMRAEFSKILCHPFLVYCIVTKLLFFFFKSTVLSSRKTSVSVPMGKDLFSYFAIFSSYENTNG